MTEGPFTDDMIRHYLTSVQTQAGIRKYAEAMAQVLAEAGRASEKVTGDSPRVAIDKWLDVIRTRAILLVESDEPSPMQKKLREAKKLELFSK